MSQMKFSAPDWCFFQAAGLEPAAYYATLAEIGISAVEMAPPERWAIAQAAGLPVLNTIGHPITHGFNRREHHAELIPQVRDAIQRAGEHDVPWVIVFSGNRDGQADQDGIDACVDGFAQLLPDAEKAGVTLLFEMLSEHNHPDYQASRTAYGVALASRLDSPQFTLVYDIYHMLHGGDDPIADITAHHAHIGHLHVAQTPDRLVPVPDAGIDWPSIVRAAEAIGYSGHWGLEFVTDGAAPLPLLQQAMQTLNAK